MPSSRLDTIRTRARTQLLDSTGKVWGDDETGAYIEAGNQEIGAKAHIVGYQEVSVDSGTALVDLPSDFVAKRELAWADASGARHRLRMLPSALVPDNSTSTPCAFALDDGAWRLWPTPNADGTLIVSYERAPRVMSADTDTSDLPGQTGTVDALLVAYCKFQCELRDENPVWQATFAVYENALSQYLNQRSRATARIVSPDAPIAPPPDTLAFARWRAGF